MPDLAPRARVYNKEIMTMDQHKRRRGDRRDGVLLRELDSLHYITGIIYPNRCDNEAYVSLRIDLTAMNEYLARKNETEKDFPYTMFHLIVAASLPKPDRGPFRPWCTAWSAGCRSKSKSSRSRWQQPCGRQTDTY